MVTITDVAQAAGVAPSTVSYVLSGKRSISPKTRRLVEESIRRLGYHPHAGARALASSRTNVIALVTPLRSDLNVAVMMEFVASVAKAAREHDYDILLLTKDEGPAALQRVSSSALADALIVMDIEADDPRVPMLLALNRPAVLIGAPDSTTGLTCVDLDFSAAAAGCVRRLADLGHRSIALIGQPPGVYRRGTGYARRFMRGFTETAAEFGIRAVSRPCPASYEASSRCLNELFAADPGITGLVVHNEAVLPAVLANLRQSGRSVPADISLIAVCPDSMATTQPVPLTTVTLPAEDVGALAVEMTVRQLTGPTTPQTRLLAPRLVTRKSTAVAAQPESEEET
ncbi:LacI family DNA-binding transcriptional regulator [Fodinicola acaciae]|uniref:LacI family DNA-binding transcriptional regulator n=1 Tax=Fodinicola acaciae TaxID=2681555 RepID=UPI0013D734AA|nr:LacI family DNA-binding transcriptional regulator [Fodinicola acaciae]